MEGICLEDDFGGSYAPNLLRSGYIGIDVLGIHKAAKAVLSHVPPRFAKGAGISAPYSALLGVGLVLPT